MGSCRASTQPFNAGNFFLRWIFPALQSRKPPAHRHSQWLEFKPSMSVREPLNLGKAGAQKILGPLTIRSRIMVECRRDLN